MVSVTQLPAVTNTARHNHN